MATSLTPQQRSLRASLAADVRWSRDDPKVAMKTPRAAFEARFEHEVDPEGTLDPIERKRRAKAALSAHMKRLALASSKARAARKTAS